MSRACRRLRSRVLTVIDCMRSLELGTSDCSDGIREAAVVEFDGHHYALIVDLVEDVVEAMSEPTPVRAAMGPGWERVSTGMVDTETRAPAAGRRRRADRRRGRGARRLKLFVTVRV